jgi:sugar lactone lactonase YvrE/4-amino-4-deoxy-L-arabinose transferase-like glycosyltransferase
MSTDATPHAPLINLAIWFVVVVTLAGGVYWLEQWLARRTGAHAPARSPHDGPGTLPATWEQTVQTRRKPAWQSLLVPLRDQPQTFLFGFLERRERWALWLIFGLALALRLAYLGSIPDTITADELDFAGNVISILQGQGPPFFGLDWTPEPAFTVHLMSWSWRLFGPTIFAERLVSALLTAVAILPFHALVRRAVAAPAALAAALLFATSWWFLHFSRSGWNNGHVVLYMLLAALALTRALERQRWRDWLAFGGALALLLYGYFSGRAVVLAFLVYLAIILWWRWRGTTPAGWQRPLLGALLAGVACTLLFLPMLVVALQDLDLFTNRTRDIFILNQPREEEQSTAGVLARQTWLTVRSFVLMDTSTGSGRYKGPGMAWLDPLSACLYLVGLILAVRRGRAACLWWCLFFIPLGLTQIFSIGIPDGARALIAVAPMYYFAALTLDEIVARRLLRRPVVQVALVGIVALTAVLNVRAYLDWMAKPEAEVARRPGIPVAEFPRWRAFQIGRLEARLGILGADYYDDLSPVAIDASIAGTDPTFATPKIELVAQQMAMIGTPGNAPGELVAPRSVAFDPQGNLYVADSARGKIVRYAPDGSFLTEWGDPSQLGKPTAVIVAPDGTIVALDSEEGKITRYDQEGAFLELIATLGGHSRGMTLGRDGLIYVAFTAHNRLIVLPGTGPAPPLEEATPILTPANDQPTAAIAATDGTLFVYEPGGERLRGYDSKGKLLFTQRAPSVDTIAAGGLALLPDKRLLLVDAVNRQVVVFGPNGALMGSFAVAGNPQGISVTPSGLIAVTDTTGRCIRLYALASN